MKMTGFALRAVTVDGVTQIPTRQEIRAYIAHHTDSVRAHAQRGGNPHHLILDHQDQLDAFAATLPADKRDEFLRIYTEETAAKVAELNGEADQQELAQVYTASKHYTMRSLLTFLVILIVVILLSRAL